MLVAGQWPFAGGRPVWGLRAPLQQRHGVLIRELIALGEPLVETGPMLVCRCLQGCVVARRQTRQNAAEFLPSARCARALLVEMDNQEVARSAVRRQLAQWAALGDSEKGDS